MKLVQQRGDILTSNGLGVRSCNINASRKAFEILSSGLYSDKVRAIIRELSANAADSHVAAGKKDVPFKVHLPNFFEPWFAVEDQGTGLSEEGVYSLYTTYFSSNKTESNDYVGAFGLGSKSPLAYTDSFTIDSRFDGKKMSFNVFLNEDGVPLVAKLGEENTDEPNGLTVKFPVKESDFNEFVAKAREVLAFFRPIPVTCGREIEFPKSEYLVQTEWCAVSKERRRDSRVVMGSIAYPINSSFLTYSSDDEKIRNLIDWGVDIWVGIGEVGIAVSREHLSYDKKTTDFLRTKLTEALFLMEKEINKSVEESPTIWQARRRLYEISRSFNGFGFKGTYKGEQISHEVSVGRKSIEVTLENGNKEKRSIPVALLEKFCRKGERYHKKSYNFIVPDGTKIYLCDGPGGVAAAKRHAAATNSEYFYLLSQYDPEWIVKTGINEVAIATSSLPKLPRAVVTRDKVDKALIYEYNANGKNGNSSYWKPSADDVEEGVYVEILYFAVRLREGEATQTPSCLEGILETLKTFDRAPAKVYGVRSADKEKISEEGGWISLVEYAQGVADELAPIYHDDYIWSLDYSAFKEKISSNSPLPETATKTLEVDSPFRIFMDLYRKVYEFEYRGYYNKQTKLNRYRMLLDFLRKTLPVPEKSKILEMYEKICKRYPLFPALKSNMDRYADEISDYVRLIDATKPF